MFSIFFKIGCQAFGGYMAIISLIERELVDWREWLSRAELLDTVAISNMLPSPIAVNVASAAGHKVYGWKGLAASWIALIVVAFMACLILAEIHSQNSETKAFVDFTKGMQIAVIASSILRLRNL